MTILQ